MNVNKVIMLSRLIIIYLLISLSFIIYNEFLSSLIFIKYLPFITNYHNQLWSTFQIYSFLLFFFSTYIILILMIFRKKIALIPFLSFSFIYLFLTVLLSFLKYNEGDLTNFFLLPNIAAIPFSMILFYINRNLYFKRLDSKS